MSERGGRVYHCPACRASLVYDPDDGSLRVQPSEPECRCGHGRSDHVSGVGCTYWNCDCARFRHQHRAIEAER